jgi:hypothetical protein
MLTTASYMMLSNHIVNASVSTFIHHWSLNRHLFILASPRHWQSWSSRLSSPSVCPMWTATTIKRCVSSFGCSPLYFFHRVVVLPIVHMMHIEQKMWQIGFLFYNQRWYNAPLRSLCVMNFVSVFASIHILLWLFWYLTFEESPLHLWSHVIFCADTVSYPQSFSFQRKQEFRGSR